MPDAEAAGELSLLLAASKLRVTLRGYSSSEVDELLDRLRQRASELADGLSYGEAARADPVTPSEIRLAEFRLALRGYDVDHVDTLLERSASLLERALDL